MSQEIKYTTDGKKVVVLGNLNSQEKIVQEVFIVNEQEIPSGENFVVKTLHDAPAVSWKEEQLQKLEKNYDENRRKWEKELKSLDDRCKEQFVKLRERLEYTGKVIKNVSPESFSTLVDFLTGEIKYVVTDDDIIEYSKFKELDDYDGRGIKLFSLFGNDDGSLTYKCNSYKDGSGSSWKSLDLCKTYEEAKEILDVTLNTRTYTYAAHITAAEKHGIKLRSELLDKYYEDNKKGIEDNIKSYTTSLERYQKQLAELNEKFSK